MNDTNRDDLYPSFLTINREMATMKGARMTEKKVMLLDAKGGEKFLDIRLYVGGVRTNRGIFITPADIPTLKKALAEYEQLCKEPDEGIYNPWAEVE